MNANRTSQEIATDRKAANAFFERMAQMPASQWARIVAKSRMDAKLLLVIIESDHYNAPHLANRKRRAAKVTAASPRLEHRLRPYVDTATAEAMPEPQVRVSSAEERKRHQSERKAWRRAILHPSPRRQRRVAAEANASYPLWLLARPDYGPTQAVKTDDAAQRRARLLRRSSTKGMTPERALEIAVAVRAGTTEPVR